MIIIIGIDGRLSIIEFYITPTCTFKEGTPVTRGECDPLALTNAEGQAKPLPQPYFLLYRK